MQNINQQFALGGIANMNSLPVFVGLLSWLTPFLSVRLFWRAVGIQPNTPLIPFLHGRSNNKILLLITFFYTPSACGGVKSGNIIPCSLL
jgi:hypothetical protein